MRCHASIWRWSLFFGIWLSRLSGAKGWLIHDPCPKFLTGESGRDPVSCRINVVCHHHIHHDPAARCQTGADGVAGLRIKLLRETESRSTDVDRNAVVVCAVIEHEFSKVGDDAG